MKLEKISVEIKASNVLLTKLVVAKEEEEIKFLNELRRREHHEFETRGRAIMAQDGKLKPSKQIYHS